ncbi:Fc.00g046840.m01.CDS01 [Cosmosporella sp. VM-42]
MASQQHDDSDLRARLASVLPKDHSFGIYHLSTPPTKSDALYSAPPHERPDRTYCENHFLAISIDAPTPSSPTHKTVPLEDKDAKKQVLVLGIEVFIYTTAYSTTLFVSKADSTGYLNLLNLPKGTASPIREICGAFIGFLVEKRRRKDVQFVVNLFARAQDQYLFPGSVDYSGKHVLDDRGLIKWWCRVLDPLLSTPPKSTTAPWTSSKAYLVVPGLETYETKALLPRTTPSSWSLTHPLEHISHYSREFDWVPPRCLIPHFPDDPKSRFFDELDEEAAKSKGMQTTGSWKSVKTLDTFWEMMAYRQECSSGRMTGFIWVVFDDMMEDETSSSSLPTPNASFKERTPSAPETPKKQRTVCITPTGTPRKLFTTQVDLLNGKSGQEKKKKDKKKKTLRGAIIPRKPRVKREHRNYLLDRPISTAYYHWPPQGRGERILDETDYKRTVELLLHLDFATLNKAAGSTRRWVSEVGMGSKWGYTVTGTREPVQNGTSQKKGQVNNLNGLVKRKRTDSASQDQESGAKVHVLSAGLVRKKPKEEESKPAVNVLSAGLVRKKPKV